MIGDDPRSAATNKIGLHTVGQDHARQILPRPDPVLPFARHCAQGRVNLVFETTPDFSGLDLGALGDMKLTGTIGFQHLSDWGRIAVITDKEWMRNAISGFAWLSPGEYRVFEPGDREGAIRGGSPPPRRSRAQAPGEPVGRPHQLRGDGGRGALAECPASSTTTSSAAAQRRSSSTAGSSGACRS